MYFFFKSELRNPAKSYLILYVATLDIVDLSENDGNTPLQT